MKYPAHFGHTGLTVGMVSDKGAPRVTVQEPVLKMRLVIQNSFFPHNIMLQEHSQLEVKVLDLAQLPEVVIINSTFCSNIGTQTIILYRSKVIFQSQVVFQNNRWRSTSSG